MGILGVKNDVVLKSKGENRFSAEPSGAFGLFLHPDYLLLAKTRFTACTEPKTEATLPMEHQCCAPCSERGQTGSEDTGSSCHEHWCRTPHQGPFHVPCLSDVKEQRPRPQDLHRLGVPLG